MNNFRLEQRGCAPAAVGQGTQSALRCILINLLMRLYPLAAREGKKEAFVVPPELCARVVLLISHISSLFFFLSSLTYMPRLLQPSTVLGTHPGHGTGNSSNPEV